MNTRILIIGAGGSGKTTLAKKIGKILKIKNKSIDDFRYSKDFKIGFSQEKADKSSKKFLKNKNWILDGIYSERYIDPALKKAKTIIVLKSRRINLILRVIKREISFRKKYNDRPFSDLIKLLYWSQKYKNHNEISHLYSQYNNKIIILRNNNEIDDFLKSLENKSSK